MHRASRAAWAFIVLTFIGVLLSTLLECRPLPLFWAYSPGKDIACQKGLANLLTMAIANMITDIMLILLPIPVLWKMTMSTSKKIQVILLFSVGIFVVCVTIARLPLIIDDSIAQSVRSLWASIEMSTACLVANMSFYYALLKDLRHGHSEARASLSAASQNSAMSTLVPLRTGNGELTWCTSKLGTTYIERKSESGLDMG